MSFWTGPVAIGTGSAGVLIPADRLTTWQPGVTYNVFPNSSIGAVGIPNRTVLSANSPLSPLDVAPGRAINVTIASPAVISLTSTLSHGMNVNDGFFLYTTGALPTGVVGLLSSQYLTAANTLYYVSSTGFSSTAFQFSLSQGGAVINSSGSQSGTQTMIRDDGPRIQNECQNVSSSEQVVKLNAGIFNISINTIQLKNNNNFTLRGSGPGAGLNTAINPISQTTTWIAGTMIADATATQLYRIDRNIGAGAVPIISIGGGNPVGAYVSTINLTSDGIKGTKTCTLASIPSELVVGSVVLIDINTSGTQGGDVRDCNISINSPAAVHQNSHGLAAGATFQFLTTGTLPPPLSVNTTYFVVSSGLTASTFQFSSASSGPSINTSGSFTGLPKIVVAGLSSLYTTIPYDYDVDWGINMGPPGDATRNTWQNNQDRAIGQLMKVAAISSVTNTIAFETPFHYTLPVKYAAKLYTFFDTVWSGIGVEELFCYGGTAGTISMTLAQYCWVKHVETAWGYGGGVELRCCYRSECRDSYIHEAPTPHPNSGAYNILYVTRTSDSLLENSISWYGDKTDTMQAAGGGNVLGYNYMDDAFIDANPYSPEAGINCGHNAITPFCLIEGNYSHKFTGDAFWGGTIATTCLRNQFSALRAAAHNLASYVYTPQNTPYGDWSGREAVHLLSGNYYANFVGNMLGKPGQVLLENGGSSLGFTSSQTAFVYEQSSAIHSDNTQVLMWYIGEVQGTQALAGEASFLIDPTAINTVLRQGNWDWFTQRQRWHGIGGSGPVDKTAPIPIPNSLYITGTPAFFKSSNPFPWFDPSNGALYTLPAQVRFQSSNPNAL